MIIWAEFFPGDPLINFQKCRDVAKFILCFPPTPNILIFDILIICADHESVDLIFAHLLNFPCFQSNFEDLTVIRVDIEFAEKLDSRDFKST